MEISLNNQRLDDLVYVNNVQGVHDLPPARGLVNAFGMSSGASYSGSAFDERVITITCTMLMSDNKTLAEKMDLLKKIIAPTGEKELVFSAYPDRYIKGRYEGTMDLEQICQMGMFTLNFYCSDPFFYSLTQLSSISPVTSFTCVNSGAWHSKKLIAEVALSGECSITNTSTNQTLKLKGNKKVIIDFETASIIGGVAENANTYYISGEFFELKPGANHLTSTAPCLFRYRSCYL